MLHGFPYPYILERREYIFGNLFFYFIHMKEQPFSAEEIVAQKPLGLDRAAFTALMVAIFGSIMLVIPGISLPLDIGRGFVFSMGVAVSLLLWLFARMKEGRFFFPRSIVLASVGGVALSVVLAAFFSEVPNVSFMGFGGELGTVSTVLSLCIALFLSSVYFQSRRRIMYLYGGILLSGLLALLYQGFVVLIELGKLPALTVLPDHLVGKWSDLAIFLGLSIILTLATLETFPVRKFFRSVLITTFVLSLLALAVSGATMVWITVGIFSLVIFVYALSFGKYGARPAGSDKRVPLFSLITIFVALLFAIFGSYFSSTLVAHNVAVPQRVAEESLRPSWQGTVAVSGKALAHDPIFGVGPARFLNSWLLNKPADLNNTTLWDANFNYGIGAVPTFAVTTGAVGILTWLVFAGLFLWVGFRAMLLASLDRIHHYLITTSFLSALYLWALAVVFVPNITIFVLAFVLTGVFLAALASGDTVIKNYDFSFLNDPRAGFISVFVLIVLFVGTFTGGALVTKRFLSYAYYQIAAIKEHAGDLLGAEVAIQDALRLGNVDLYYRAGAEINMAQANQILASSNAKNAQAQFSAIAQDMNTRALAATQADPTNYLNYLTLAHTYVTILPILPEAQRAQAHDQAMASYQKAQTLNPQSPAIMLEEAQLEIKSNNIDAAKQYIAEALNKKGNYIDAIFLLVQIQDSQGKLDDAIQSAETAALIDPNNVGIFFELGLLDYKKGDYAGAINAFERAVILNPYFANAKYYLGLSYSKAGRRQDAIAQFNDIASFSPENAAAVKDVLEGLTGSSTTASTTSAIEKNAKTRSTPPLNEDR